MKRKCDECGSSWSVSWYSGSTCPFCESEEVYEDDDDREK